MRLSIATVRGRSPAVSAYANRVAGIKTENKSPKTVNSILTRAVKRWERRQKISIANIVASGAAGAPFNRN